MSMLQPGASHANDFTAAQDAACRVKHVVPTGAVFAAALERLNRQSTITLFQELAHELEVHSGRLSRTGGSEEFTKLRTELLSLLALLQKTTERHQSEVAGVKQQLVELQELSAKTQAEFENHLCALVSMQIEQQMAPAVTMASARLEQQFAAVVERDLKPVTTRMAEALAARKDKGWRACLIPLLLALLLGGGIFAVGLFAGRKTATITCPPSAAACAGILAGPAAAAAIMPAPQPESLQAAMALGRTKDNAQVAAPGRVGVNDDKASAAAAKAVRENAAGAAANSGASSGPVATRLALAGMELRPNSMEAEMLEFFMRPGARAPHTFTMDRLRYPPRSHEVNPDGKEQVYFLAKLLAAYPTVKIEIRGHNDGTESEVYTGPNPFAGYTLSQLRADCVYKRLTGLNIPADRMRLRGLASTQPVSDDGSEEGRQLNRRVEIVVLPH